MPDPVTSRSHLAADRAAGGPPRANAGGQPLKSKTEKRAAAKAARARAQAMRKRRQTLAVGGAAAAVLALVVGLIVWVDRSSSPQNTAAAGATAGTAAAAAFPPLPAGADPALGKKPAVTAGTGTVSQLRTTTLIRGTGAAVQSGQTVGVNYVGVTYAKGTEFDSSWKRSEPFSFQVGAGRVIKGWDQGLIGVNVGSRVQLDIPSDMAYGDKPNGPQPPGALRFVVDVLSTS